MLGCSSTLVQKYCKSLKLEAPKRPSSNRKNLEGKKIGKLTVLAYEYTIKKTTYWSCLCDCGNKKTINGKHLKKEKINSCGCIVHKPSPKRVGFKEIPGNYIRDIKSKAGLRDFEFSITPQQMWDHFVKQNRKCALSGIEISFPLNQNKQFRTLQTASLDRIDSTKGYTNSNVQWVHKHINLMKQDLPNNEFINWCKKISEFNCHLLSEKQPI